MDLFALVARLTLDTSGYDAGLAGAEAGFSGFEAKLREGLSSAEALGAATTAAAASCEAIGAAAGDATRDLTETLLPAVEQAVDGLSQWLPTLTETGSAMMAALGGGMSAGAETVTTPASQTCAAIEAVLGALGGEASGWGDDLMGGFIGGMAGRVPELRDTVASIAKTVRDYLHFSEPDAGPLADFHTYAPDMMALFAQGIRDNAHLVSDQIQQSFNLAPDIARAASASAEEELVIPHGGTREDERPVNIVFELDGVQQWVYRLNRAEEQRVGLRLAGGGA